MQWFVLQARFYVIYLIFILIFVLQFYFSGFEAGGSNVPSNIFPWTVIGENQSSINVSTELSSCFERNKVALRMDVYCDGQSCPPDGVGISNPGFWGMVGID